MPLITSTTELNKYKFGMGPWSDKRDSGNSNQPYITRDIPGVDQNNPNQTFEQVASGDLPARSGPDFILRDGFLAPVSAVRDVSRLAQMFFDFKSPNGPLFIAKQNILSRASVKTPASYGLGYAGPEEYFFTDTESGLRVEGGGFVNQGVYTPLSTLGQALGGFAGLHLNAFGIDPTSPMSGVVEGGLFPEAGLNTYEAATKKFNETSEGNRLVIFSDRKKEVGAKVHGINGDVIEQNLYSYSGGPGSILGIGRTNIKFADQRTGASGKYGKEIMDTGSYAAGNYQTSRPSNKTKDNWLDPFARGASKTYDLISPGTGSISSGSFSSDGGYTYTPRFSPITTETTQSLEPRKDIKEYQTVRPDGSRTGSFISPISNSLSTKYKDYTGTELPNPQISAGSKTFNQDFVTQTTDPGTLNPIGSIKKYQTLGKSVVENTSSILNPEGSIRINYSNSISPSGSSGLYETLTKVPINNDVQSNTFNVYDSNLTPGNTWPDNINDVVYANGTKTYTQQQLIDKENVIAGGNAGLYPEDFRKELYDVNGDNLEITKDSSVISLSPNYRVKNKDVRLYQGQPGKSNNENQTKNVWNYGVKATDLVALDKVTASPMYDGVGPDTNQAINDLCKFRIAAINNDKTNGSAVYMHFRAFLDSFSDNYNATWNAVNYVGRGDTLYNYGGFGRTLSLSFTVAAQSKAELIPMYKKLNYLASTLAPDYSEQGFMRGNLVRLTVGGYLYEQPGFITSLTYDVPQETPWEIGINENGGSDPSVKELPHVIKVSGFQFTPIHDFLVQKPNSANNPTSRFISLSNGVNSNYIDSYRKYTGLGDGGGDNNIET